MTVQSVLEDITNRPGHGDVIAIINPATEEVIAEFRDGGAEAVDAAVTRARASFTSPGIRWAGSWRWWRRLRTSASAG